MLSGSALLANEYQAQSYNYAIAMDGQPRTVVVAAEPLESPWYAEVAAFYGFAANDLLKKSSDLDVGKANMVGGDMTFGYRLSKAHSFNFRAGYGNGNASQPYDFTSPGGSANYGSESLKIHTFSFMPGYRYSYQMEDNWGGFVGVNLGLMNQSVKYKDSYVFVSGEYTDHIHMSDWGFGYSVELGLSYKVSKNWDVFVAYEFRGGTAEPTSPYYEEDAIEAQQYHIIRAGATFNF